MSARRRAVVNPPSMNFMVKILSVIYVGGAYGLVLVSLVQAAILVSWLRG
ncbi:MAG: hypothetical protein HQL84_00865 [Magnetococcales bacterium]|nr:hypothetical protein [Magnetococcales bacterium]MBF0148580.1 hypothetical protein [Magnetococcales bacterium]MBF0172290.1 hypothetical protein [Magnetococcales bacterium]MBF0347309.1 hypothetical protein [Magnetococcales bacterium]MBF0629727.1 hypothetical protein [Magnetococcales bacterium]